MKQGEKMYFLDIIKQHTQKYRITILRNMLYSLYPFKDYFVSRVLNKLLRVMKFDVLDFEENFREKVRRNRVFFDTYFHKIIGSHINVVEFIPYDTLCDEISNHNFAEVTPRIRTAFLPARAASALASGTPLLLKRKFCTPLEEIIKQYGNGLIYDDYHDIAKLLDNNTKQKELYHNAMNNRLKFTLENYTNVFSDFMENIVNT